MLYDPQNTQFNNMENETNIAKMAVETTATDPMIDKIRDIIDQAKNWPEKDLVRQKIDEAAKLAKSSENVDVKSAGICLAIVSQSFKEGKKLDFGSFRKGPAKDDQMEDLADSVNIILGSLETGQVLELADHLLKSDSLSNDTYKNAGEVIH